MAGCICAEPRHSITETQKVKQTKHISKKKIRIQILQKNNTMPGCGRYKRIDQFIKIQKHPVYWSFGNSLTLMCWKSGLIFNDIAYLHLKPDIYINIEWSQYFKYTCSKGGALNSITKR